MLSLLAAVLFTYSFPTAAPVEYEMNARFEGFLPIFGGIDGNADIMLAVTVKGIGPDTDGSPRVEMDLSDAKVKLKDAALPFDVDSVRKYFPKTTLTIDPLGRMLKTDAPDVALPIRLPGLDVKRFPELCFLPIEFPKDGMEQGKEWSFTRTLDGVEVPFTAKLKSSTDAALEVDVSFKQTYTAFENEAKEIVVDQKDAVASVATVVDGTGTATFDRAKGLLSKVSVVSKAHSVSTPLAKGDPSARDLTTTVTVELR